MNRGVLKWVVIAGGGAILLLLVLFMLDPVLARFSSIAPIGAIRSNTTGEGAWEPVASWSGRATKSTETFHISSSHWRISWTTNPVESGPENFQIFVHSSTGGLRGQAANVTGSDSGSAFIRGAGNYYLVINTAQPYHIEVEEIEFTRPTPPGRGQPQY